jgi:hypothetical protein
MHFITFPPALQSLNPYTLANPAQALGQLEARVDDMAAEVDALKGPRGGQGVGLAA